MSRRLPLVGPSMLSKQQDSVDADTLAELQSDFGCVAVNTFGRAGAYTYIHEGYAEARRSFIDFIFLRRHKHRQCRTALLRNFEVGRWRKGGRHLPVQATFTLRPYYHTRPVDPAAAEWPAWKCKHVHSKQPQQLNEVLLEAGRQVFHITRPSCLQAENPEHVGTIRQMWYRRSLRSSGVRLEAVQSTMFRSPSCTSWRMERPSC